jgi:hypothetical protein
MRGWRGDLLGNLGCTSRQMCVLFHCYTLMKVAQRYAALGTGGTMMPLKTDVCKKAQNYYAPR